MVDPFKLPERALPEIGVVSSVTQQETGHYHGLRQVVTQSLRQTVSVKFPDLIINAKLHKKGN